LPAIIKYNTMRRIVLFMHTSLDGFVAGPAGEMDWIHVDDEMFGYAGRETDKADTALYGRVTYEMMEAYWPTAADKPDATKHDIQHSNWYNSVEKIVVSRTMQNKAPENVTVISDSVAGEIYKLKQREGNNIVIFGSPSIGRLLTQHKLIDEYWLFINPIMLGKGIPLFPEMQERLKLTLLAHNVFYSGVVALQYGNAL
jgi:dihydrofolate reductase